MSILALICSSVLVVINRCMVSAAEMTQRMNAFDIARENMEKILVSDSVKENIEYGSSEKYPGIQWQTTVETFYPSDDQRMWVRAVCAAEYTDTKGELKKIELTNWLTDLTEEQSRQVLDANDAGEGNKVFATLEEAAKYAGVDAAVVEQWLKNGMIKDSSGGYIKSELDLYKRTNGNPTIEDRIRQKEQEQAAEAKKTSEEDAEKSGEKQQ